MIGEISTKSSEVAIEKMLHELAILGQTQLAVVIDRGDQLVIDLGVTKCLDGPVHLL